MSKENDTNLIVQKTWGEAGPSESFKQMADLAGKFMSAPVNLSPDGSFFHILKEKGKVRSGIQEIYGHITAGNMLQVVVQLVKYPDGIRVSASFIDGLQETNREFRWADPPRSLDPGQREIWFEFQGDATPIGPSRANAFLKKLETLNDAARRLLVFFQ